MINYFVGLARWTPFFWGQDRYGMAIPFLSSWVHTPILHLLCQNFLHMLTTFFTIFCLAQIFWTSRAALLVGAIAIDLLLLLSGYYDLCEILSPWQIYSPALLMGCLAFIFSARKPLISFSLLVLMQWMNVSSVLFFALLMLLSKVFSLHNSIAKKGRDFILDVFALALAFVLGEILRYPFATVDTPSYYHLSWRDGVWGWFKILQDFTKSNRSSALIVLIPFVYAWFSLELFKKKQNIKSKRTLSMSLCFCLLYIVLIGFSGFAKINGYPKRYLMPPLLLFLVTTVGFALTPVLRSLSQTQRKLLGIGALVPAVVIVCLRFSPPTIQGPQSALQRKFFLRAEPAIALDCTHIVGDYYRVWPIAFYTLLFEKNLIYPISYRSGEMKKSWQLNNFKAPRICIMRDDARAGAKYLLEYHFLPLEVIETTKKMVVLGPRGKD